VPQINQNTGELANMKWITALGSFLPWIIYSILSSAYPPAAVPVGLILFLFNSKQLMKGFILEWGSLLFFITLALNHYVLKNMWLFQHMSICISCFFVLVAGISLLIHRPFTLQYAKLEADQNLWDNPLFLRVNHIMTGVLGSIFLGMLLVNIYRFTHPGVLNGWFIWFIVSLAQITFIKQFPKWYRKKHLKMESP
jgi:hypothetical protein